MQNLPGIALMLDAALHSIETGKLDDATHVLATALERQRATIRELRDLSFALEPVVLRDQGFGPALQALAEQVGTAHRAAASTSTIDDAEQLGETAQVALYTIIRELLDQAIRRGPPTRDRASTIAATARRRPRDDASPTTPSPSAGGARSRRSRSASSSCTARSASTPSDDGTRVVVTLPPYATRRVELRADGRRQRLRAVRLVARRLHAARASEGEPPQVGHEFEEGEQKLVVSRSAPRRCRATPRACVFSIGR